MNSVVAEKALFNRVRPVDLAACWPFVERGIVAVLSKCPDEPWTPKDIHSHLADERAALYLRADGFLILEQREEPISQKRVLNVWLMWFEPGHLLRDEIAAWLDNAVRLHKCEWWQFSSPRDGWGKILEGCCTRICSTWGRR